MDKHMTPASLKPAPRKPDWQLRLMQYVADRARLPVDPAAPVCAEFAAGAVEAMTGEPLGIEWRGKYRSIAAGLAALQAAGHADHVALVAAIFDEIAPARANPGDIAVIPTPSGIPALGIVQGAHIYVQAETGLGAMLLTDAIRAFRVI